MARKPTGQVIERPGKDGARWAIRFRAYGKREYVTTTATTRTEALAELDNVLADVRRGIWRPPAPEPVPADMPTFHSFASEWFERITPRVGPRTLDDYRWALELHLLPEFGPLRLDEITKRHVDAYSAAKQREGVLSASTINKTLVRLAQILADAVEYDLIAANPATGRRRRLPTTRPRRGFVTPEQLPTLLDAAEKYLHLDSGRKHAGRGRPLLATLAGAGLRIQEALDLERRHVNLARGTLTIDHAKTEAGVRVVDLTPALREELTLWLDRSPFKQPTDPVFPTLDGKKDNRQNVRRRLLVNAIEAANKKLVELKLEPIGAVGLHGLRRTYATLRTLVGDDPVYVASQLGHTDPTFSLRVYAQAVTHRERLTAAERKQFEKALEWARMGTNEAIEVPVDVEQTISDQEKAPR